MRGSKGELENQVVVKSLRVKHSVVGKDGVVQVDTVLGSIYHIQSVFLIHTGGLLVTSTRANLVQIRALDAFAQHVFALGLGEKKVLESLVDSVRCCVLDNGGGKLDN